MLDTNLRVSENVCSPAERNLLRHESVISRPDRDDGSAQKRAKIQSASDPRCLKIERRSSAITLRFLAHPRAATIPASARGVFGSRAKVHAEKKPQRTLWKSFDSGTSARIVSNDSTRVTGTVACCSLLGKGIDIFGSGFLTQIDGD